MLGKGRNWFASLLRPARKVADLAAPPPTLAQNLRQARLLVAEDFEVNREFIKCILQGLEPSAIDTAENGKDAVMMAKKSSYDIILMDINMPGMDGYSATKAIRKLPGYAKTPIIAFTASDQSQDRQRCIDAGIDAFLSSPIKPKMLYATLLKCLESIHQTPSVV